ncbi:enoyl-CoA hydratase-related protein [Salipiger bermudensis]|uniref:enoyl-CoA hydratase-related protein n=1 Tax=Salipiger bermudensis TaxID=344736 RepID=UPI0030092B55
MSEARDTVGYSVGDGVVRIGICNPPVNALVRDVRAALIAAFDRAADEEGAVAIVLYGEGATFASGAELSETDGTTDAPTMAELCARVEASRLPVVAALHGTVLGAGVELALAAHYRVADAETRIGFPEVKLGLMPSAGATQRLPRLAGAGAALEMMLTGQLCSIDDAPAEALADLVVEEDALAGAAQFVEALLEDGGAVRPTSGIRSGFSDPMAYQQAVAQRREALAHAPELAPREIVAAVEAAILLPFEAGLAFEADAAQTCRDSEQSRALRAAFVAEHRARRLGLPEDAPLPDLSRIAVLGGGPLAIQLVFAALVRGIAVQWGTRDPAALREGVPRLRDVFDEFVRRGALSEDDALDRLADLRIGDSAAMTGGVEMIVHAARGQGDVPAPEGIPRVSALPGKVRQVGLRFAPPIHAARLIEVIVGPAAMPEQIVAARALAKALDKIPVRVTSRGESIASRLLAACQRAADALVDLGQHPYEIDRSFRDWGWHRPPFLASDQRGLPDLATRPRAEGARNWCEVMVGHDRAGRTGGAGFYLWEGTPPVPSEDPGLTALLDAERPAAKPLSHEQIRRLILGAMANEGARMLASGMVARPSDIDVVATLALDLPRWRGGPMHLVGVYGLLSVRRAMDGLDHPDAAFWAPEPVFGELIKNGRSFEALNR